MYYTEREICGSYRRATNKAIQIDILSQLNACDTDTIKKILAKNGLLNEKKKTERMDMKMATKKTDSPTTHFKAPTKEVTVSAKDLRAIGFRNVYRLQDEAEKVYIRAYLDSIEDLITMLGLGEKNEKR